MNCGCRRGDACTSRRSWTDKRSRRSSRTWVCGAARAPSSRVYPVTGLAGGRPGSLKGLEVGALRQLSGGDIRMAYVAYGSMAGLAHRPVTGRCQSRARLGQLMFSRAAVAADARHRVNPNPRVVSVGGRDGAATRLTAPNIDPLLGGWAARKRSLVVGSARSPPGKTADIQTDEPCHMCTSGV
jgi:hypothetical protein